jgi:hypothetical protein
VYDISFELPPTAIYELDERRDKRSLLALSNAYLDLGKRERKTNKEFVVWVMKPRQ